MFFAGSSRLVRGVAGRARRLLRAALGLLLGLSAGVGAVAAPEAAAEYLVRNWTTAEGVPHNTVRSILESRDGYLWMGTANGLARFDGVRFQVFDLSNTPGLISDDIYTLHEDRGGRLWLRTRRGLAKREGGRFEFLSMAPGGTPAFVHAFAEDREGTLWMLQRDGLLRWSGDRLESVAWRTHGALALLHICAASDGGLWLVSGEGLWRYRDGVATAVATAPVPTLIAAGPDGRLWGLLEAQRLYELVDGGWKEVAHFGAERCSSLFAAPNGDVWVGSDTRNLAYRFRGGQVTEVNGRMGLEGNRVLSFAQDREGNVWMGLNAGGLFRLRERRVTVYGRSDGLEGLNTSSVAEEPDGSILVSIMGSTLHRFAEGRFTPIRVAGQSQQYVNPTAVAVARSGGAWAGTFFGGLIRVVEGREVERIGSEGGTRSLLVDREGGLWRGTRTNGVEWFSGTNVTRYTTREGLSFDNVYCLAQDRSGAIWAGTEQGLNWIEAGRIRRYGTAEGLGHQFVSALFVDSRGTLWVGTLGGGLSGWTGSRFVTLTSREGLPHDAVEQLVEDDYGYLWLGTRGGLMRLSLDDLHEYLMGERGVVNGTLVGANEGLVRPNLWTEYQPACLKARDGRLWFCTGTGVAVVDPRRFQGSRAAPVVHVEEVTVDGRMVSAGPGSGGGGAVVVAPGSERLEIRYTGISPSEPEQVRFAYQLAGYDREWVEVRRSRVARYSHLPPGSYRFRVKAVNNDGAWGESEVPLAVVVQPRFVQTAWFRAAVVLLGVAGLYGIYRVRFARLERRRASQEAFSRGLMQSQEQERKRIAGELHDGLGQSLIVVRNLALIAARDNTRTPGVAGQFQEISDAAATALSEVRSISHALRPVELDRLGLGKSIEAAVLRVGDAAEIRFTFDGDPVDRLLPPEREIGLYRILQECLNNIVKHSQAGSASVTLRRDATALILTVVDDGRGFVAGGGGSPPAAGSGMGLVGIVERARALGGVASVTSRPGVGTRVEVVVPIGRVSG